MNISTLPEPDGLHPWRKQVDDCFKRLVSITDTPVGPMTTYQAYDEAKKITVPADHVETNKLLGKPLAAAVSQWQCHRYMETFVINIKNAVEEDNEIRPLIIDTIKNMREDMIMGTCTQKEALKREEQSSPDDMSIEGIYYILYGLPHPSKEGYTWN